MQTLCFKKKPLFLELKTQIRLEEEDDIASLNNDEDSDRMVREARELVKHSARMEARMRILSDHNTQLETQLGNLRRLLGSSEENGNNRDNFGTLQSRAVVAAELFAQDPVNGEEFAISSKVRNFPHS